LILETWVKTISKMRRAGWNIIFESCHCRQQGCSLSFFFSVFKWSDFIRVKMFVQRYSFSIIKYKCMLDLMTASNTNHEVKQQTIFLLYCIIQHIFVNLFDNLNYFAENEIRIMWRLWYEIRRRIWIYEMNYLIQFLLWL